MGSESYTYTLDFSFDCSVLLRVAFYGGKRNKFYLPLI